MAAVPEPDGGRRTPFLRRRDFYAGGLLILLGLVPVAAAPGYSIGTLTRMGPGFMPLALGILLIVLGIVIAGSAGTASEPQHAIDDAPDWRGWICVLAGPVLFLLLGSLGGLVPAIFACVFVSALGDRTATLKGSLILAVVVTLFGVLLFAYLLRVPMPVLAWRGW